MRRILSIVNVVIAIGAGTLVLLGYFAPVIFGGVRDTILQVAIILAGFALLVGIANLLSVHWKKLSTSLSKGVYSGVLLFGFVVTVVVVGLAGPTGYWSLWIFNSIQVPVEASLMAILAIVLVYAAARLLRRRCAASHPSRP